MKRLLSLIFLLMASVSMASTTWFGQGGLKFGLTGASENWNYFSSQTHAMDKVLWGIHAALFADVMSTRYFAIQGEVAYSQGGAREELPRTTVENPAGDGTLNIKNRLNYVGASLYLKGQFPQEKMTPYLFAGPGWRYQTGTDIFAGMDFVYDEYPSTEFGLTVGAGIEMPRLLPLPFLVEALYYQGFTELYKSDMMTIKNRMWMIRAGLFLTRESKGLK